MITEDQLKAAQAIQDAVRNLNAALDLADRNSVHAEIELLTVFGSSMNRFVVTKCETRVSLGISNDMKTTPSPILVQKIS